MNPSDTWVLIDYHARPGCGDVAARELSALVATVREREPDCTGIAIVRHDEDSDAFTLIETWTSREAYAGPHLQTPHLLAFKARAGEFMAGPPGITYWGLVTRV